ncbi:hypothetical protein EYF80_025034 [Liparis tanakae]|uniref:Uncharacterized protein n=1 Tax=Liparis tanakae TaxID=230148 RepID=A0A4Z2HFT2_9TELE|nr:hypothetical protein EYF80_025034 [Liparis tanakae]
MIDQVPKGVYDSEETRPEALRMMSRRHHPKCPAVWWERTAEPIVPPVSAEVRWLYERPERLTGN